MRPYGLVLGTALFSFSPAIIYALARSMAEPIFTVLMIVGLFYLPMGLLAVAMFDSFAALNPALVMGAILRVPLQYITTCLLLVGVYILAGFLQDYLAESIPFVGAILSTFVFLYFLMVEMRILGLLYYANAKRLGWFERV